EVYDNVRPVGGVIQRIDAARAADDCSIKARFVAEYDGVVGRPTREVLEHRHGGGAGSAAERATVAPSDVPGVRRTGTHQRIRSGGVADQVKAVAAGRQYPDGHHAAADVN